MMLKHETADLLWRPDLIEKYNMSGPRYTSYPTALEFKDGFTQHDLLSAWNSSHREHASLYVHVPFCHQLCYYCGCNKVITRHAEKADAYIDMVEQEIARLPEAFKQKPVHQLHWGGGTPTFLDEAQTRRLMGLLTDNFMIVDEVEASIEIDPREIELDHLDLLWELGFRRISIGIQDFSLEVQQAVNRVQDEAFITALIARAKRLGFASINLDLIYGLPLQTPERFATTLKKTLALDPDRLSVFNYAHLPQRFAAQRKLKDDDLPTGEQKLALFNMAITELTNAGYQFIGMDHFAKSDDELAVAQRSGILHRNFQGYTTHGDCDLLGLGVSAISQVGESFAQNSRELKEYYSLVDEKGSALVKGVALSQDDVIRQAVIKQIICNFSLNYAEIEQRFGLDFSDYFADVLSLLEPMERDGLLTLTPQGFTVEPPGRLLIRNICMCFDAYLPKYRKQQAFSRVI